MQLVLQHSLCHGIAACIVNLPCSLRGSALSRQSFASHIPSSPMLKVASRSGSDGEATILHCLFSPRPFFSHSRVVDACAMMLPPIGFTDGPANMLAPSRFAATTCMLPHAPWQLLLCLCSGRQSIIVNINMQCTLLMTATEGAGCRRHACAEHEK